MSNVKNFEGLSLQQLAEALLGANTARKEAEEAEEAVKAAWKARVDAGEVPMSPKGKSRVWTGQGVAVSSPPRTTTFRPASRRWVDHRTAGRCTRV